ncbi:cupin domain-containing protein [Planobispora rosea]|uniref:cupin domain-containing protein n=1 Tax=Planobispora rosea TaxID=35762 RepID=UPI00159EF6EF|nr:cupin domain-containing protein [Planobispora rosea]
MGTYPVAPGRLTPGTQITVAVLWEREDKSEVGAVWEMTPGVLDETQGNESFVILSGRSRVDFPDGRVLEFGPGDVGVLAPGDTCRWTTLETMRKVVVFRIT